MFQNEEQTNRRPEGFQLRDPSAWQGSIGRWRERLVVLNVVAMVVLVLGMAMVVWRPALFFSQPDARLIVGSVAEFPPGSVTEIMLETTFVDPVAPTFQQRATVSPVPAYVVHDPAEGFFVWYRRDTHSACPFVWVEAKELFIDPCHGSAYTRTGAYKSGPAPRALDRFGVTTNDAVVIVDISLFQPGTSVPGVTRCSLSLLHSPVVEWFLERVCPIFASILELPDVDASCSS